MMQKLRAFTFDSLLLAFVLAVLVAFLCLVEAANGADPTPPPKVAGTPIIPPIVSGLKVESAAGKTYTAGKLIVLRAETACKRATWIVPPGIEADPNDGGLKLVCVAPAGQHTLYCVVAPAADTIEVAKVVLDVQPATPGPGPNPGPAPKPPTPPDPPPNDAFQAELRQLFAASNGGDKKDVGRKLAALYQIAAGLCGDQSLARCDELLGQVADAAKTLAADALIPVRRRVAEELGKVCTPDAELTDPIRKQLADVFTRAASALEAVAQ
jgi:hypothetical protein